MHRSVSVCSLSLVILLQTTPAAFAHTADSLSGGFVSGLLHPIFGWDHVVAMVAVGLWGAVLGRPALWVLPIVFPLVMALGAVLGIAGINVPFIEVGIALSGVVIGLMIVFLVKAPMAFAAILVGLFAIFHGHAHGTELPDAANPIAYSVGFVIATGMLHVAGILFGTLMASDTGRLAVRAGGGVISLIGAAFLFGIA